MFSRFDIMPASERYEERQDI